MKITHDFHIHTHLSLCAKPDATVEHYINRTKELGLYKIGFANHFWDENIEGANEFYVPQNFAHLEEIKEDIKTFSIPEVQTFFGCECEYDPIHHGVAVTEAVAEKFDYLIVSNSHTHMTMPKNLYEPYEKHIEFMVNAYEEIINCNVSPYITAVAHPFEAVCCPYDNRLLIDMISDDEFKKLFDKTAEKNIAFEINIYSMIHKSEEEIEKDSFIRMFRLAKDCGCKFIFGSDSHDSKCHDFYHKADFIANLLGLNEDDITSIAK